MKDIPAIYCPTSERVAFVDKHEWPETAGFKNVWVIAAAPPRGKTGPCACCGKPDSPPDYGSGGPYRCGSRECMVF